MGLSGTDSLISPSMGNRMLGVSACSMGALARLIENPEINAHTQRSKMKNKRKWKQLAGVVMLPLLFGQVQGQWIINEINADPIHPGLAGDANGDGVANVSDDEFVEFVNYTTESVDIGGWTVEDGTAVRHTFAEPTIVASGQAVVVFGGGTPSTSFGTAIVVIADTGTVSLNNGGDTLTLRDGGAVVVATVTYGSAENDQSLTRDLELLGAFVDHSSAATSGGGLFSPGTQANASDFIAPLGSISLTPATAILDEAGGVSAITVTLSVAPASYPYTVMLTSDDIWEATVPASVDIVSGTSAIFNVSARNDFFSDGPQIATITGTGVGYGYDSVEVTVNDVGDTNGLVINEFDANPPGSDEDGVEYIELFDGSGTGGSLDVLVLVLINGSDDTAYEAIDLTGESIPAGGFFTLSNGSAPGDIALPTLQNGTDAIALYVGSAEDYDGKAIGVFPPGAPIDAVIYGNSADTELEAFFGISTLSEGAVAEGVARAVDGTGGFVAQAPTPGATNDLTVTGPGIQITAFSIDPSTGVGSARFTDSGVPFYKIQESNDLDEVDPWTLVDVSTYTQTDNGDGTITLDFTDVGADGVSPRFSRVVEAP